MKLLKFNCLITLFYTAFSIQNTHAQELVKLGGERMVSIHSNSLNRDQKLLLRLPINYDKSNSRYPVVFYFDAHDKTLGNLISANVDRMMWTHDIPEVILVGIPHGNRQADLGVERTDSTSKKFLNFITDEAVGYINKNYRTENFRVFIGHSLGGQFAINALTQKPGTFNSIIAISPALYYPKEETWYKAKVLKRVSSFIRQPIKNPAHLYFCSGDSGFQDNLFQTGSIRLDSVLRAAQPKNITWKFTHLKGFNHGTSPLSGIPDGLAFVFDDWHFSDKLAMEVIQFHKLTPIDALNIQKKKIMASYGIHLPVDKNALYQLGQYCFEKGNYNDAKTIIQENIKVDTKSSAPYAAMADVMLKMKNTTEAIKYYRLAINNLSQDEISEKSSYEEKIKKIVAEIK